MCRISCYFLTKHCFIKKVCKKMWLKWPEPEEIHKAEFPNLCALVAQNLLILRHYYIQIIKDRFRIQAYKIRKEE